MNKLLIGILVFVFLGLLGYFFLFRSASPFTGGAVDVLQKFSEANVVPADFSNALSAFSLTLPGQSLDRLESVFVSSGNAGVAGNAFSGLVLKMVRLERAQSKASIVFESLDSTVSFGDFCAQFESWDVRVEEMRKVILESRVLKSELDAFYGQNPSFLQYGVSLNLSGLTEEYLSTVDRMNGLTEDCLIAASNPELLEGPA